MSRSRRSPCHNLFMAEGITFTCPEWWLLNPGNLHGALAEACGWEGDRLVTWVRIQTGAESEEEVPKPWVYTVPEAAKILRISTAHAYKMCERGKIPTVTFGKAIRVPRLKLEELLAGGTGGEDGEVSRSDTTPIVK